MNDLPKVTAQRCPTGNRTYDLSTACPMPCRYHYYSACSSDLKHSRLKQTGRGLVERYTIAVTENVDVNSGEWKLTHSNLQFKTNWKNIFSGGWGRGPFVPSLRL